MILLLDLNLSKKVCYSSYTVAYQGTMFSINDTKLCVSVVTLLTQDNAKLLEQQNLVLEEQFAEININQKYQ